MSIHDSVTPIHFEYIWNVAAGRLVLLYCQDKPTKRDLKGQLYFIIQQLRAPA